MFFLAFGQIFETSSSKKKSKEFFQLLEYITKLLCVKLTGFTQCFSIRTVVNSGKISVLNLQPSSLPSIHESDLKPYVVFLTPSSPQISRAQANKHGQLFKVGLFIHIYCPRGTQTIKRLIVRRMNTGRWWQ